MPDLWAASDPRERACAMFDVVIYDTVRQEVFSGTVYTEDSWAVTVSGHPRDELRHIAAGESWPSSWRWTLPPYEEQP